MGAPLNFPPSPTTNQLHPQPAVAGQPVYRWDGEKWTIQSAPTAPLSQFYISDTPPLSAADGAFWWESDTGLLYVRYNDGDSTQWVCASPLPDMGSFVAKTGDTMTGPLVLAANPSAALGAATKQYVDNFHTRFTNALAADVLLNNTTNYFDGPTVAQGTSGVWFASGTVTVVDTTASAAFIAKLWDGTTVVASAYDVSFQQNFGMALSLSGIFVNPTGNIRISCRDIGTTAGRISANLTQNGNKDSSLSAFRIG